MSTKSKKIPKNPSNEEISSRYHANDDVEVSKQFESLDLEIDEFLRPIPDNMGDRTDEKAELGADFKVGADANASTDPCGEVEREKLKRMPLDFIPSFQVELKAAAKANDMSAAEFVRRSAMAAMDDPSILNASPEREAAYLRRIAFRRSPNRNS